MMGETNPVVERYLSRFAAALSAVPDEARREMVQEIRSHIAEALHTGRDPAEVLEKLGPADRLAAAYRAEMMMHRRQATGGIVRQVGLLSALAGTSLVSFIVITVLFSVGLSFGLSGLAVFLAGAALPLFPPSAINSPFTYEETRVILMIVGAVCLLVGAGAGWGLWAYAKFAGRTARRLVDRIRTPSFAQPA